MGKGLQDRTVLLHNPQCSKSRSLRDALVERGVEFEERLYLEQPLDREELIDLARRLDRPLVLCLRTKDEAYKASGLASLSADERSERRIREALLAHPQLLERPILVHAGRARVGRPTEHALELLDL